jgi:hypothetical protein
LKISFTEHWQIAFFVIAVIVGLKLALNHISGGQYAHFNQMF